MSLTSIEDEISRLTSAERVKLIDILWESLVRQADAEETVVETIESELPETTGGDGSNREKIEALADMICQGGEESSAALFVLMAALQNSTEPKALAHVVKHFAFTRCGELNVYGMVDSQMAVLERELFT